jgi:hypothetical protein
MVAKAQIQGINTEILRKKYSNLTLFIITQTGGIGQVHSSDVLLGQDLATSVYHQQLSQLYGECLLFLSVKNASDPVVFREIMELVKQA